MILLKHMRGNKGGDEGSRRDGVCDSITLLSESQINKIKRLHGWVT